MITFPNAYHAGFNTGAAISLPCPSSSATLMSAVMWATFVDGGEFPCHDTCWCARLPGFNCAEAVNFGPPDWLPWGTYVADKYRREGRSATLSHDALLIALVGAAPDVSERLKREAEVRCTQTSRQRFCLLFGLPCTCCVQVTALREVWHQQCVEQVLKGLNVVLQAAEAKRVKVKLTADEDAGTVTVELCVPSQPADVKMEDGDVKMEEASEPAEEPSNRASSQQTATTSGRDYVPGTYSAVSHCLY